MSPSPQRQLHYSKDGRLLFDKEMKKDYTVLIPNMLPIHFKLICNTLNLFGYHAELLETTHRQIVNEGLQNVHNDTCYPALLVIGQFIDALKSGKYDVNKTALFITQTGGGCRASNYIHLLRKALIKSGFSQVPVISVNLSGLERNPGFSLTPKLIIKLVYDMIYGDLLMLLSNQCRPYELHQGETDALVAQWITRLTSEYQKTGKAGKKRFLKNMDMILSDFSSIPLEKTNKIKVGVVGEIFIKYSALGNNNLEKLLAEEGVEVVVPGLMDFMIFKVDNRLEDIKLYGGKYIKYLVCTFLKNFFRNYQDYMIEAISQYDQFTPPAPFPHTKSLVKDYLGYGNKMGEGWLLTAEMLELIDSGVNNIVCTQPFGCLPNHVAGKGMIKKIRQEHPTSNIVAIDYDPGAAPINQENRIKLMLANARRMEEEAKKFKVHDFEPELEQAKSKRKPRYQKKLA